MHRIPTTETLRKEKFAAERLGLSEQTLRRWRMHGIGPAWCKLNGAVRYRDSDLDNYITESVRGGVAQVGA